MNEKIFAVIAVCGISIIAIALAVCVANKPKEEFAELYFKDMAELDSLKRMSLDKNYSFEFAVVSHENRTKTHVYAINSSIKNENGKVILKPHESKTIKVNLTADKRIGHDKLMITLDNLSIYFFYSVE